MTSDVLGNAAATLCHAGSTVALSLHGEPSGHLQRGSVLCEVGSGGGEVSGCTEGVVSGGISNMAYVLCEVGGGGGGEVGCCTEL